MVIFENETGKITFLNLGLQQLKENNPSISPVFLLIENLLVKIEKFREIRLSQL